MQVAATLMAAGAKADELPMESFEEMQADFDARLLAEPKPESPADRVFRELGLAS
jgi:hypothetical protein